MTSKSSFLVNLKENNKRRLWVWVLSALILMLAFPVLAAMTVSQIRNGANSWADSYGQEAARAIIHARLVGAMSRELGFSTLKMLTTALLAIVSALQGFSWLYSRKKVDFYMGMPVKRKKRFFIIWLNGILIWLVPALLGLMIEALIAAGNGALDKTVILSALAACAVRLLFYLGVYHTAILAVMLTGNVIITCFGLAVLFLYEYAVRSLRMGYSSFFLDFYTGYRASEAPLLSPFSMYMKLAEGFHYENTLAPGHLAGLAAFALGVGALAFFCYLKRPAEAAGSSMTFAVTRPAIKILLTVPASLIAGILMAQAVNYQPKMDPDKGMGYMIFAILLVVVLGSGLIQVIYEFDIKGAVHRKREMLVSGALCALIFAAFRYDLTGFDSWVPAPEQVESAAFVPDNYEENRGDTCFDQEGRSVSAMEYADRYMYLRDVETLCDLARHSIDGYEQVAENYFKDYDEEKWGSWSTAKVLYRLKNGKQVCRKLLVNVNDGETVAFLDRVMGSGEFKEGYMPGASTQLQALLESGEYQVRASYGNMVYNEDMSREDAERLLAIYREDLEAASFSRIRDNIPEGVLRLQLSQDLPQSESYRGYERATRSWYVDVNIYSFNEKCMDFLKEKGYYMEYQFDPEDISYIQVMNRNSQAARELIEKRQQSADLSVEEQAAGMLMDDGEDIDTRSYAEYSRPEEIQQIASCSYPEDFVDNWDWDRGKKLDGEYRVYVYFRAESDLTRRFGTSAVYGFAQGEVPDFVAKDTAWRSGK